ncbi:hypothetical protein [Parapedobacter sp.]
MKTRQSFPACSPWMVFTLLFISTTILSCSKDKDEVGPVIDAKNELTYNGQTFPLNYGAIDDYEYDGSHTNYEFHLFHIISETDPVVPTYLYIDLFSPNDSFKGGTFHYIDTDNGEVDLEGKYYFDYGYFSRNVNVETQEVEEFAAITGGTVKVSGSGSDYKLEFDLAMDNGKTVKGSYGGTFSPLNATNAVSHNQTADLLNKLSIPRSVK